MDSPDPEDPTTSGVRRRDESASFTEISTVAAMFFIVGIGFVTMSIVLSPPGKGVLIPYLITGLSLVGVSFALPLTEGMCRCCYNDDTGARPIEYSDSSTQFASPITSSGPSRSWLLGVTSSETINGTVLTIPLSVPVRSSSPGALETSMITSDSDSYARTIATSALPGACSPNDKSRFNKLAHTTVDRASTGDYIVISCGDAYPCDDDTTSSSGVPQTTCHADRPNQTTRIRSSGAIASRKRTKHPARAMTFATTLAEVISQMRIMTTPGCATLVKILDHCLLRTFRTPLARANCLTSQDNVNYSYFARARRRNHSPGSLNANNPPTTRSKR